ATRLVSSAQLNAVVPASQLAVPGTVSVLAVSSGGASDTVSFNVIERGDINANRSVSAGDALACALFVGRRNRPALPLSVGDVNLNGTINIGDCLNLFLFAARVNPNLPSPAVTLISPGLPVTGDTVTIIGTGFSPIAGDNRVLFTTASPSVTRVVPSSATTTALTVT